MPLTDRAAKDPDAIASAFVQLVPGQAPPSRHGRVRQTRRLLDALVERIDSGEFDLGLDALMDFDRAAESMLHALPGMDEWNARIGPVYRLRDIASMLNLTMERIVDMVTNYDLVQTPTVDRVMLFPSFQFDLDSQPLPYLSLIARELDSGHTQPWRFAGWLNTWSDELGSVPAHALRANRFDDVLRLARDHRASLPRR